MVPLLLLATLVSYSSGFVATTSNKNVETIRKDMTDEEKSEIFKNLVDKINPDQLRDTDFGKMDQTSDWKDFDVKRPGEDEKSYMERVLNYFKDMDKIDQDSYQYPETSRRRSEVVRLYLQYVHKSLMDVKNEREKAYIENRPSNVDEKSRLQRIYYIISELMMKRGIPQGKMILSGERFDWLKVLNLMLELDSTSKTGRHLDSSQRFRLQQARDKLLNPTSVDTNDIVKMIFGEGAPDSAITVIVWKTKKSDKESDIGYPYTYPIY